MQRKSFIRGRGASHNPRGRFERLEIEDCEGPLPGRPPTIFLRDVSRSALARNSSPDIGFDYSLNVYRGCEHGCAYCFARPTHEYLGFSAGLDFETRILVKHDAPELLRRELRRRTWNPQPIAMSGVTDPYQPVESRLELTRACLAILAQARNPVVIVTKNHLVTRDLDLLSRLARVGACRVMLSIPTLDAELAGKLEPRASAPARRLAAVRELARAGVPAGVLVAPVIPGLTDHELPDILAAAAEAGASTASYVMLRLPWGLKALFEDWLRCHRPERAERVLSRVRDVRQGRLHDSAWGRRQRGTGPYAGQIAELFRLGRDRYDLGTPPQALNRDAFRRPPADDDQIELFGNEGG
jgi:DNA repair photolyase